MSHPYQRILTPFQITPNTIFHTRLLTAACTTPFVQGPEDYTSDALIHHYRELARNGASMIQFHINDVTPLEQRLKSDPNLDFSHMALAGNIDDPMEQNKLCQLTEEVHIFGAKIVTTPHFMYPQGYTFGGGDTIMQTAFGWRKMKNKPIPHEMIPDLIRDMVADLKRFKSWGFDGISYRSDLELNASENVRTDEYGGSIQNRCRFMKEFFTAVKKELGKDFIIEAVMGAEQPHGYQGSAAHGYDLEDTVAFSHEMEGLVDLIQVRESDMTQAHPTGYTHAEGEYRCIDYCRRLKAMGVVIPLSANGGIQDPDVMEAALQAGDVDLFSLTRAFFCDPDYYQKIRQNRKEDIVPCIQCNKCHGTMSVPWITYCSVNPRHGMDHKTLALSRQPVSKRRIAVIGGGPAGMRTALFAAEKGHAVTLFEKTDYLGGQLSHADYYKFKWPIRNYRLWLIRQLEKSTVEIRMNTEPSPEELKSAGYDAIFACTGSHAVRPAIPGADDPAVISSHEVWGNEDKIGQNVVIIGGSEVGMEAAIQLAQMGRNVTVLTRQSQLGHDCNKLHYVTISFTRYDPETGIGLMLPEWDKYENLTGITHAVTTRITPNSVTYVLNGKESTITCDTVIVGGGTKPNTAEAMVYAEVAPDFHLVGDVEGDRGTIQYCNRSAFAKVNIL